jgi:hypothetical protein
MIPSEQVATVILINGGILLHFDNGEGERLYHTPDVGERSLEYRTPIMISRGDLKLRSMIEVIISATTPFTDGGNKQW